MLRAVYIMCLRITGKTSFHGEAIFKQSPLEACHIHLLVPGKSRRTRHSLPMSSHVQIGSDVQIHDSQATLDVQSRTRCHAIINLFGLNSGAHGSYIFGMSHFDI